VNGEVLGDLEKIQVVVAHSSGEAARYHPKNNGYYFWCTEIHHPITPYY